MRTVTLGVAAAAAWSAPALAPVVPAVCRALGVPRTLPYDARGVALTFDDGPHPEGTPALLDLLGEAGVRATFFLVGEQVERLPEVAARIAREGHAIALHGHRHRNLLRIPPRALARDLAHGARVIEDATGHAPRLYRPPYGIFSPAGLALARRRGLWPLLWSRWGHDWRGSRAPEAIARELTREVRDGDVLLLHDADHYSDRGCWRNTLAAMPAVLRALEHRGLAAVTPAQPAASP
ncbi:MAG TPA: polysaccharide deacetylase family protein [Thermoleophilaceae bacterium]|nr:polysaccharide deacetylase family protein [Thermoleophilaceae bacterium]